MSSSKLSRKVERKRTLHKANIDSQRSPYYSKTREDFEEIKKLNEYNPRGPPITLA